MRLNLKLRLTPLTLAALRNREVKYHPSTQLPAGLQSRTRLRCTTGLLRTTTPRTTLPTNFPSCVVSLPRPPKCSAANDTLDGVICSPLCTGNVVHFWNRSCRPPRPCSCSGGHRNSARRLVQRLVRSGLASFGNPAAPMGGNPSLAVDRPRRLLQHSKRGVLVDCFADARLLISLPASIEAAIEVLHRSRTNSIKDVTILRSFVTATLLPWDFAANVLFARGVLSRQLSAGEISVAEQAREFWRCYDLGRRRHWAAVASEELALALGDWALFSPHNLSTLLPPDSNSHRIQAI